MFLKIHNNERLLNLSQVIAAELHDDVSCLAIHIMSGEEYDIDTEDLERFTAAMGDRLVQVSDRLFINLTHLSDAAPGEDDDENECLVLNMANGTSFYHYDAEKFMSLIEG